ncbi:hypothetical protein GALL_366640 [mine drainage metagenome]|uniref:Uncharacterized protein n=1 Tax=mine drainage metagenome TaxID=410659 RepID=A0A1J5QNQ3_9ZZZZ
MQPGAKAEVGFRHPTWGKPRGILEHRRVAVGGGQKAGNLSALGDHAAQHLDILVGVAGEHVQRRVETQHFLHRRLDAIGREGGNGCAGFQQGFHSDSKGMHRRLMPRVQQQDAGGDKFVGRKLLARLLGGNQVGDEVIGRTRAALFDVTPHEGYEILRSSNGAVLNLTCAARLIHRDHGIRPAEQIGRHLLWHAQQAGDDDDRQLLREGRHQIERPIGKGVDQRIGKADDFWRKCGDTA